MIDTYRNILVSEETNTGEKLSYGYGKESFEEVLLVVEKELGRRRQQRKEGPTQRREPPRFRPGVVP